MSQDEVFDTPRGDAADADAQKLLEDYPGLAFRVTRSADVLASNTRATRVVTLLGNGDLPEVQALIAAAAQGGVITSGIVSVPTQGRDTGGNFGGDMLLEVTVLPGNARENFLVLARDQTMERNLRSALVESRQRYKDMVEVSSDFYWETSPEGKFVFVSPKGGLGYQAEELIGRPGADFVVEPDAFAPLPFVSQQPLEGVEIWFNSKDGGTDCMLVSCVPLYREDGEDQEWSGARGVCRDVTEERLSEAALSQARHRKQLLGYIVSSVRDELDPQQMLETAATATARALAVDGCRIYRQTEPDKVLVTAEYGNTDNLDGLDEALQSDIRGNDAARVKGVARVNIGPWRVLAAFTQYRQAVNGAVTIWKSAEADDWDDDHLVLIADIANQLGITNEQLTNHERIVALSRTDSMTGLLNRRSLFEDVLPRHVARLKRDNQSAALFFIDMDNFKLVNDMHGHKAGDDAIIYLRDMLLEFSRPGDVIARLGGDEFAIWLDGINAEVAENRARHLIDKSISMKEFSGTEDRPLGISVGVAVFEPDTSESMDELLARADRAMYVIKKAEKGGYHMAPPFAEAGA